MVRECCLAWVCLGGKQYASVELMSSAEIASTAMMKIVSMLVIS